MFMKKPPVWKRILALLLLAAAICPAAPAAAEEIIVPTCTQDGYALMRHPDGTVTARRNAPAPGHSFGPWTFDIRTGKGSHVCQVCGTEETVNVREEGLPRLLLSMDEDSGTLWAELSGSAGDVSCPAQVLSADIAEDGQSVLSLSLRLLSDDDGTMPLDHVFPGWPADDCYTLTACGADPASVRAMTVAALWRETAVSRAQLPERLRMLPFLGGTDGFPLTLWLSGSFSGLYLWSPRLDGSLFGMYRDENAAVAVSNGQGAGTRFSPSTDGENGGWSVLWKGSGSGQPILSRLNQLIHILESSDDGTLSHTLSRYLDVDAAIDLMILTYALGLTDTEGTALLYYGEELIPALLGAESAFGAEKGGQSFRDASDHLPKRTADGKHWQAGMDHPLFERLLNVFEGRVAERYLVLRQTVLTEEHILSVLDGQMGRIPAAAYALNAQLNPGDFSDQEERARIAAYLRSRLPLLDAAFGGNAE